MTAALNLTTELETFGGRARFVVSAPDPISRDRLPRLGYLSIGADRFATRWFEDSPEIPGYYERFAASIGQMVLQSARLAAVPWEEALLEFLQRVDGAGLNWWLYGTAALAVRGVEIMPGDVDVSISDSYLAGELLHDLLVAPVEELEGWVAKRVGRAFCHAVIEWLSEPVREFDDPDNPNEQGPHVGLMAESVQWRGYRVLVPPLATQLASCERRGLTDRADLIRSAMHG